MDMVKRMWPVRIFHVPDDEVLSTGTEAVEANAVLRKRQYGNSTTDTFAPHVMTQVDKLRADGVTGKGVKIGIIDTGVSEPGYCE
jgi:subtilisin family serine protease